MSKLVHLHWAGNQRPFSRPTIYLDLLKLRPTPETIAAIFGVRQPDALSLTDQETNDALELIKNNTWAVEPDKHYEVHVVRQECHVVPNDVTTTIKELHQLVGGTDRVQRLSLNFYKRVWYDKETPAAFQSVFRVNHSDTETHAHHQSNWFCEIWGGPKLYSEQHGEGTLLSRMLKKHTQSRMTAEHALSWLRIMTAATNEEFAGETTIQEALGLYWLHFFAFFPFDDQQRTEFRRLVFPHNVK